MKLTLVRRWFGPSKTISKLYVNGIFCYYVLEDLVRPEGSEKVYGETAIAYGKYPVSVSYSPKLNRVLPLIEKVPGFSGIRIHAGIDEEWTDGCLLISRQVKDGKLVLDYQAEREITAIIKNSLDNGNSVILKVTNYQRRTLFAFALILSVLSILYLILKFFIL